MKQKCQLCGEWFDLPLITVAKKTHIVDCPICGYHHFVVLAVVTNLGQVTLRELLIDGMKE